VASQFEALEAPSGEPDVFHVDAREPTARQLDAVLAWLATIPRSDLIPS